MKTLLLNPPSYEGFDGGAGSRYQAKREIRSFWYPTWLAQAAALIPGCLLIDAPARGLNLNDLLPLAGNYELLVIYTSTPSFPSDIKVAESFRDANPKLLIGLVGAHVMVLPVESLSASPAIDFVCSNEFDYTIKEIAEGKALHEVDGITYRDESGEIVHTNPRELIHDMDALPSVLDVYERDLVIEDYFIGYLKHPYVSLYTGRGCKSKCSFCLWPQTIGGHVYRTRSPEMVAGEVSRIKASFPQVEEVFFDDDTFTDNGPRAEEIARLLGPIGLPWSCNAKANVPRGTLKVMKDNGLRLLLVGYESGVQKILNNIRKGTTIDRAREFTKDCHDLGIVIHGTFIMGLPGETTKTIQQTIKFAREINPYTIQVSLAAAYPGTHLYKQAKENEWLLNEEGSLIGEAGLQVSSLQYPDLPKEVIFDAVEEFYRKFYFRPSKVAQITWDMLWSWQLMKRRLREGVEFFKFLHSRKETA